MLNPRIVLPEPSVKALVAAATVVTIGVAPPVAGKASLFAASVNPVMLISEAVAPCPITFCVFFSVRPPV